MSARHKIIGTKYNTLRCDRTTLIFYIILYYIILYFSVIFNIYVKLYYILFNRTHSLMDTFTDERLYVSVNMGTVWNEELTTARRTGIDWTAELEPGQ